MIAALLAKEAQQHAPALLGACGLVAVGTVCGWVVGLQESWPTLLTVAHGMVWLGLPMLVLFTNGRLVVHDHQAGTHEFLAALPIAPALRAAVRFALGLAVIWGVGLAVLGATALLASRREGVPISFLLQLAVQYGAYLLAWHGLAFGIAHTGRFRYLLWWLLLVSLPLADAISDRPMATVYWFGLVLEGADRARLSAPFEALPGTLAYALAGTAAGFFVSTWRGGALLERWFRPTTADQRARLIGVGVAAMLAAGALGDQAPRRDPWQTLPEAPAERASLRVAASPGAPLWDVARDVAEQLDALGAELGIERWPPIVLLRSRPGERPVAVAPGQERAPPAKVLLVDPTHPRDDLVRRILSEALAHRLSGLVDWDPDARWLVDGLAPWWTGGDEALRRRAALGTTTPSRDLGPDVAAAVAWRGLQALEEEGGRQAVLALARAVLGPKHRATWPSGLRLRVITRSGWVGRITGVDEAAWLAAWERKLREAAAPETPPLPPLSVEVRDGEAVVAWEGPVPAATVLEWTTLDPLQRAPLPWDETERLEPPGGASEVALRADIRLRVAARWVRTDPELGLLASPWVVRR